MQINIGFFKNKIEIDIAVNYFLHLIFEFFLKTVNNQKKVVNTFWFHMAKEIFKKVVKFNAHAQKIVTSIATTSFRNDGKF